MEAWGYLRETYSRFTEELLGETGGSFWVTRGCFWVTGAAIGEAEDALGRLGRFGDDLGKFLADGI